MVCGLTAGRVDRSRHRTALATALRRPPVVAILGPRQIGKTTLAGGLVVRGRRRLGFEFKRSVEPELTKSMRIALADLKPLA